MKDKEEQNPDFDSETGVALRKTNLSEACSHLAIATSELAKSAQERYPLLNKVRMNQMSQLSLEISQIATGLGQIR